MSLPFNDTNLGKGIIQELEDYLEFNDGDISGNPTRLKKYTAKCNIAMDAALALIFRVGGKWQFDDSNHLKYNIITSPLFASQRNYFFTTDEQGNLILDIYKVFVRISATGIYQEIDPVDVSSDDGNDTDAFTNSLNITGVPYRYDKLGNGIFLDPPSSYNSDDGLMIYIAREGSYFTIADTSKMPGFSGLFHRYIPLKVASMQAGLRSLKSANFILSELAAVEKAMEAHYGQKGQDERPVMRGRIINPRTGR